MSKAAQKVWRGKEWFTVLAPKMFDGRQIGETPSLDPNSLVGRTVETSMIDLSDDSSKYYLKVRFRIIKVEENRALTRFDGLACTRDYVLRLSQRRTRQIGNITDVKTKDGWAVRVKTVTVMNRIVQNSIEHKVWKFVEDTVRSEMEGRTMDEFLANVISGNIQEKIKLIGSKIYPIRVSEIIKIDVFSAPSA